MFYNNRFSSRLLPVTINEMPRNKSIAPEPQLIMFPRFTENQQSVNLQQPFGYLRNPFLFYGPRFGRY